MVNNSKVDGELTSLIEKGVVIAAKSFATARNMKIADVKNWQRPFRCNFGAFSPCFFLFSLIFKSL